MHSPRDVRQNETPAWCPEYAHATADVPPVAFRFRESAQDFEVSEVALLEPSGSGTHLWFELTKRGLATREALRRLARVLGRREAEFGYAGLKDARALTRQTISIEHADPDRLRAVAIEGVEIGRIERHDRKLRRGALAGNRFSLALRGVDAEGHRRIEQVLERLAQSGLPNYYGAQRFGATGRGWELGRLLVGRRWREYVAAFVAEGPRSPVTTELAELLASGITGEERRLAELAGRVGRERAGLVRQLSRQPDDWCEAARSVPRRTRQLSVSALQSRVFNRVLAGVLARGPEALTRLEVGDVAFLHAKGASFLVTEDDLADSAARLASFELSPSGPLPGSRLLEAEGAAGERERAALAAEELCLEDFRGIGMGLDARGARRPLRVPLREVELRHDTGHGTGEGVTTLCFRLPAGAYATTLLEEFGKHYGPPPGP